MSAMSERYDQLVAAANGLMDEMQSLASQAVEAGAMTDADFRAFDPYAASDELIAIDNDAVAAGPTPAVVTRLEALVDRLTHARDTFRAAIGGGAETHGRTVVLATVGGILGAGLLVGLFAYLSRGGAR